VPNGVPLSGPGKSSDVRPCALSEVVVLVGLKTLAMCLNGPFGLCVVFLEASVTPARDAPPSLAPIFRPSEIAFLLVILVELAGSGADPAPGAGRLLASSEDSTELSRSLALRFPV
jgi:hypothetical protein